MQPIEQTLAEIRRIVAEGRSPSVRDGERVVVSMALMDAGPAKADLSDAVAVARAEYLRDLHEGRCAASPEVGGEPTAVTDADQDPAAARAAFLADLINPAGSPQQGAMQ